ncbi:mannosyl-3-phosphoglycerate phosphatase [mine drainage metagenome]|uniref:Mannosyl-3-phosphoglycerate phosphatase n=1 Tax=mine drainage metagenome TaxID=410659 RepID=A0A1J5Q525_9ZZZZ
MTPTLQALATWPLAQRRQIVGIFSDIDDTLTTAGAITPDALQALADLQAAGLHVMAITGRPIGWCASLMRGDAARGLPPWPVDAMIAENGAVAFVHNKIWRSGFPTKPGQLLKLYQQEVATRTQNQARMQAVAAQVLAQVEGVQLTRDSAGRETDLAFDYNEFARLSPQTVQQVLGILQRAGMHTSVSSIHIHGCFGDFNKWTGANWIAREWLGCDLKQDLARWVFVGDSGNDQAMFEHFTHSVGVANIRRFEAQITHLPRYITPSQHGAGFAEVARAILQARTA